MYAFFKEALFNHTKRLFNILVTNLGCSMKKYMEYDKEEDENK